MDKNDKKQIHDVIKREGYVLNSFVPRKQFVYQKEDVQITIDYL